MNCIIKSSYDLIHEKSKFIQIDAATIYPFKHWNWWRHDSGSKKFLYHQTLVETDGNLS